VAARLASSYIGCGAIPSRSVAAGLSLEGAVNGNRLLITSARVGVRLAWAALLLLGATILLTRAPADWLSRAVAWLSAGVVVAWLAAHLRVRRHGTRGPGRVLDNELGFEPATAPHSRIASRRAPGGLYRHRSHGERPRFD
jgi:hypothetical protein